MKKYITTLGILLLGVSAYAQTYTVERVIDGDTIVVTTPEGKSEKVHLIGIDTPERKHNDKAKRDSERTGQDLETITKMGQEATEFLRTLIRDSDFIDNENVLLELDVQKKDKYGRLLAYVFMRQTVMYDSNHLDPISVRKNDKSHIFVNAAMIHFGFAQPMTIPPNVKYADLFKELYKEARETERGLWKDNKIIRIIKTAELYAKKEGINLDEYPEPTVMYVSRTDEWMVTYTSRLDYKTNISIGPLGIISVYVDDKKEKALRYQRGL